MILLVKDDCRGAYGEYTAIGANCQSDQDKYDFNLIHINPFTLFFQNFLFIFIKISHFTIIVKT